MFPFHQPTPPPLAGDEWIAIFVALGVLGGTAGWIVVMDQSSWSEGDRSIEPVSILGAASRAVPDADGQDVSRPELGDPAQIPDRTADPRLSRLLPLRPVAPPQPETAASPRSLRSPFDPLIPPATSGQRETSTRANRSAPSSTAPSPPVTVPVPPAPSSTPPATLPVIRSAIAFSDVDATHWAQPYINALTARGIIEGFPDGTYAPDQVMTRAEFAAQIARAFPQQETAAIPSFVDVDPESWAASPIQTAVALGFMQGYPEQQFRPEQPVSRAQVLVALVAGLGLSLPAEPTASAVLQGYTDGDQSPAWATGAIAAAVRIGLVASPSAAPLRPNQPATRAEVATMLHQALAYLGQVPALTTGDRN